MARADLHNAFAVDREIYEAALVDPALMDPVVRVDGGVPGTARPFLVVRRYQGPQGFYLEHFTVIDPDGQVVARSAVRRIQLEGEMFEDRFSTLLENVHITSVGEHTVTFYVDDDEVGSIPLFIETADGGDPRIAVEETLKKALKKSSIVWVTVPPPADGAARGRSNGRRRRVVKAHTQPAWFVYDQDKVYIFSGPTEQHIPGLAETETVELSARSKDIRSLVSRVTADVEVIGADDERFDKIGRAGLSKRLNLTDGDAALDRWKQNCILVELTPRLRSAEEDAAAAAAPAAAGQPAAAATANGGATASPARRPEDDIHVEAEIDQEVFDRLVNEGQPERVARAKAKAAFVRAEKQRLLAERQAAAS